MIKGRRAIWLGFLLGVAVVVCGVAWLSVRLVSLERAEADARAGAERRDRIRLALWRMDALVAPIIAAESARDPAEYRAFREPVLLFDRLFQQAEEGEWTSPSPLLFGTSAFVRLHYEIAPDGSVRSPQAPTGNELDLAEGRLIDPALVIEAEARLVRLGAIRAGNATPVGGVAPARDNVEGETEQPAARRRAQAVDEEQRARDVIEKRADYSERRETVEFVQGLNRQVVDLGQQFDVDEEASVDGDSSEPAAAPETRLAESDETSESSMINEAAGDEDAMGRILDRELSDGFVGHIAPADAPQRLSLQWSENVRLGLGVDGLQDSRQPVVVGDFTPRWIGDGRELVIERDVVREGARWTQGVWLDWSSLETALGERVGDLGLAFGLEPSAGSAGDDVDELASLPVRVVVAPASFAPGKPKGLISTLVIIWVALGLSILAAWLALRSAVRLGDRRGRFVSAVTHELRTPLTTFQLYSQLLDGGMAPEHRRAEYVKTLRKESERLSGVVENVLTVAQLERKRAKRDKGVVALGELLDRIEPGLKRIANEAGMTLEIDAQADRGLMVPGDGDSVERILTNLVENATKYAGSGEDRRIHLATLRWGKRVLIEVADHGPGVPRGERGKVFKPFRRAKREEGGAGRGLGLGLSLARGLARSMGGELKLVNRAGFGAVFQLALPIYSDGDS